MWHGDGPIAEGFDRYNSQPTGIKNHSCNFRTSGRRGPLGRGRRLWTLTAINSDYGRGMCSVCPPLCFSTCQFQLVKSIVHSAVTFVRVTCHLCDLNGLVQIFDEVRTLKDIWLSSFLKPTASNPQGGYNAYTRQLKCSKSLQRFAGYHPLTEV